MALECLDGWVQEAVAMDFKIQFLAWVGGLGGELAGVHLSVCIFVSLFVIPMGWLAGANGARSFPW